MSYYEWPKYVSVAERKMKAAKYVTTQQKKGCALNPVVIEGRIIAKTFWGKAWCSHLETYSDFATRLPRGRTYVRNGSVIDLQITKGKITAQVMGSELYQVTIEIKPLPQTTWKTLVKACAGQIDSLIELLQGRFSKAVMAIITEPTQGLFPKSKEISMRCSCPDYAGLCKHLAAVLYGVGAALDLKPEWLFHLRHVDHIDLITVASTSETLLQQVAAEHTVAEDDLSALFGIEMDATPKPLVPMPATKPTTPARRGRPKTKLRETPVPSEPPTPIAKPIPPKRSSKAKPKPKKASAGDVEVIVNPDSWID